MSKFLWIAIVVVWLGAGILHVINNDKTDDQHSVNLPEEKNQPEVIVLYLTQRNDIMKVVLQKENECYSGSSTGVE